ncbi:RNase H domain-containing protein [Trichonephila clavipes]|nr:RNase H domain-containing protein [Trichonephila clavipes]
MDSTGLYILSKLVRLGQRKQVYLQWIPSHVGVPGNEAADELAGRGCDLPNPSSTILTHTEIHFFQRNKINLTWRNPPVHHSGLSIQCRSSRAHQTSLARLRSGHLRSMTFVQGVKSFFTCPCSSLLLLLIFWTAGTFPCDSCMKSKTWCMRLLRGKAIHQNDHQARRRFVEWAQNEIAVVPDFHKRILFSDEAHFWLNGYVNKQNCRIWGEANPQVYVETPLHQEKLTVWCALWAGGILLLKR